MNAHKLFYVRIMGEHSVFLDSRLLFRIACQGSRVPSSYDNDLWGLYPPYSSDSYSAWNLTLGLWLPRGLGLKELRVINVIL